MSHTPVLLKEVLEVLCPKNEGLYIDATFGGGGYTKALLEAYNCRVIACDRDPEAVERAFELQKQYPDRLRVIHTTFSDLFTHIKEKVDGIVFDFGTSSYQLDQAKRGFSFRLEGALDMRMSKEGMSASHIVNTFSQKELEDIIFTYGEEKKAKRIAKAILENRKSKPFETTLQLAKCIEQAVGYRSNRIHSATLTFQALRIFVNNELIEIQIILNKIHSFLKEEGRLIMVTFHSLEDRLIKSFLKDNHLYKVLFKKPLTPSDYEILCNKKARSAKLRAAVKRTEKE